jgi:DNA polymerase
VVNLGIDLESYSEANLKEVGLYKYAAHPSTEILMISYGFDQDDVLLWDCTDGSECPPALLDALQHKIDCRWSAFNAPFERELMRAKWDIYIPLAQWEDTMLKAWSLSFSGGLGDIGAQLGLNPDKRKLKEGKALINRFCKPAPKSHKADRYDRHTHPEEWERFKAYCRGDTIAEREIAMLLKGYE